MKVATKGIETVSHLVTVLHGVDPALSYYAQKETHEPSGWHTYTGVIAYPDSVTTIYRLFKNGVATKVPCVHLFEKLASTLFAVSPATAVWFLKTKLTPHTAGGQIKNLLKKQQNVGAVCAHSGALDIHVPEPFKTSVPDDPLAKITEVSPVSGEPLSGTGNYNTMAPARDATAYVTGLYILEEIFTALLLRREPTTHSVAEFSDTAMLRYSQSSMWVEEFTQFRAQFVSEVARNMFDYLVIASVGEARHHKSSHLPSSRKDSYRHGLAYDPRTILPTLSHIFDTWVWHGAYGGKKWGAITKAATLYWTLPPVVFADHCVDLTHNGGCAFNKAVIFSVGGSTSTYKTVLDTKRAGSLLRSALPLTIPASMFRWLQGAVTRNIIPQPRAWINLIADSPMPPLAWGNKPFTLKKTEETHGVSTMPPAEAAASAAIPTTPSHGSLIGPEINVTRV